MTPPTIVRACRATLIDSDGREYIDMFSANGTAWLGHSDPAIVTAIQRQLDAVSITGSLPTPAFAAARDALAQWIPDDYQLAGLTSSGMEAFEFATRIARVATRRNHLLGFSGNMHGKSAVACYLGWDNNDLLDLPHCLRLPYVAERCEEDILALVEEHLGDNHVAAICIEPIQASNGGHRPNNAFFQQIASLAAAQRTCVIFDELLTGFHRTGPAFFFQHVGVAPDILLLGKALGNGFPVSAVMVRRPLHVSPAMLPGSTYAGNPLAATAVAATLHRMHELSLSAKLPWIEQHLCQLAKRLAARSITVRGMGAMWFVELPTETAMRKLAERIYASGIAIGFSRRWLRLLPPVTIEPDRLQFACDTICRCIEQLCE
ncbi:MAG: aminotransferase class III-fold pyridoxal phosphate-dependent enzyme [Pirellulaceae bacterium]|nr:aminotransferase class III-fold pyridoxal phosphate-dependent enzyme [Planctomycetales bacterium]